MGGGGVRGGGRGVGGAARARAGEEMRGVGGGQQGVGWIGVQEGEVVKSGGRRLKRRMPGGDTSLRGKCVEAGGGAGERGWSKNHACA